MHKENLTDNLCDEDKFIISILRQYFNNQPKTSIDACLDKPLDFEKIKHKSIYHHIAPFCFLPLSKNEKIKALNPDIINFFKARYNRALLESMKAEKAFFLALKAISDKDIKALPVRGAVYLKTIYKNCPVREMDDIDLYIDRKNKNDAQYILRGLGYRKGAALYPRPWQNEWKDNLNAKIDLESGDFKIDLHWKFKFFIDRIIELNPKILWKESMLKKEENFYYYILPPEEEFHLTCLHASSHMARDASYLRILFDLASIIKHCKNFSYKRLLETAKGHNTQKYILPVLSLVSELFIQPANFSGIKQDNKRLLAEVMKQRPVTIINLIKDLTYLEGAFKKIAFLAGYLAPSKAYLKSNFASSKITPLFWLYVIYFAKRMEKFYMRIRELIMGK